MYSKRCVRKYVSIKQNKGGNPTKAQLAVA